MNVKRIPRRSLLMILYAFGCVGALGMGYGFLSGPASASHQTYTSTSRTFNASTFNGYRVYLSAPTHTNSGKRGELGWDENINGRHWNNYAANSNLRNEVASSSSYRNLRTKGYHVRISENSKNGRFSSHVTEANNWGADVYVTTHTNAGGGSYFLTMVDKQTHDSRDDRLRTKMDSRLGNAVPGSDVQSTDASSYTNGGNLYELSSTNKARYNVYNEVIFHDNQNHVNWFGSGSNWKEVTNNTWRYGYAIDDTLGYP